MNKANVQDVVSLLKRGHYYPELADKAVLIIESLLDQIDILSNSRQLWIEMAMGVPQEDIEVNNPLNGVHPFTCICDACKETKRESFKR